MEKDQEIDKNKKILEMATTIISSYIANNSLKQEYLSALLTEVYQTLSKLTNQTPEVVKQQPAVTIKRSVFPDYIICLEDGKKLKMLKRHLKSAYGLTPDQYREKWRLSPDYPMVAPNYAQKRSTLAHKSGLGKKEQVSALSRRKQASKNIKGQRD
ncbi:MucR family transcriptional regulator [Entomobacter blattae]|uniref:ROS/MUCR transcriptional regulator protein n=1 Tax=Entomobacter blattae TaxID=2762277 RepID=A0A7H1NNM4_9PROT|nr:MucR family transcriptional regulator [Entomobacter blattae]QNT77384.1 ROS/MUCR transcriptional regulator protein [Entomobacter blattae]